MRFDTVSLIVFPLSSHMMDPTVGTVVARQNRIANNNGKYRIGQ
jgi:hypothetical protein